MTKPARANWASRTRQRWHLRAVLAEAYRSGDRAGAAISLLKQTLADVEHVYGETHPVTLTVGSNLAALYRDAGRLTEALPLYERILGDAERTLNRDHPTTQVILNGLAATKQALRSGPCDESK